MPLSNYPVYCWTYLPMKEAYPGMVKNWADLGINHPLTPIIREDDDKEAVLALLDECQEYGISPILNIESISGVAIYKTGRENDWENYRRKVRRAVKDYGGHPAAFGVFVTDEPDVGDAEASFKAARIIRDEAPEWFAYLNLLPWFDWIGERMGTDTLANYLDRCIAQSGLSEIGYDCYTQGWKDDTGWNDYFCNLYEYMQLKLRSGVNYNTTLLCQNHYKYECKSQADYRWQISTAAAMGAKGIGWFFPDGHTVSGDNYREAPINQFGDRTASFGWMSDEMRIFHHQFGELMMSLDIEGAYFTEKSYGGIPVFEGDNDLTGISSENENVLLSFFKDKTGTRYLAAVNTSRGENVALSFTFAGGVRPKRKEWDGWKAFGNYTDAVGQNSAGGSEHTVCSIFSAGQLAVIRLDKQ